MGACHVTLANGSGARARKPPMAPRSKMRIRSAVLLFTQDVPLSFPRISYGAARVTTRIVYLQLATLPKIIIKCVTKLTLGEIVFHQSQKLKHIKYKPKGSHVYIYIT